MERNFTHCASCVSKRDWCDEWRPPPFPDVLPHNHAKLVEFMKKSEGFRLYADECHFEIPKILTSTVRTTVGTTKSPFAGEAAHTAGGTIAGIVIVVLIIVLLAIGALLYLWKRKKMRTGSINSLPLKKYEDTNYLDNKARANLSWSPSSNPHASDAQSIPVGKGNDYGSLPKGNDGNSMETRVGSPREFDKLNSSVFSEKLAFCNENFMNDGDQNEAVSPGVNSQTPLFDMIDGPALPNVVSDTVSENSIHNSDKIHRNGSLSSISSGRTPPVDMAVTKRRISSSSTKSPKKKKPIYLQRKSEPVDGLEDIAKGLADNRNSV